MRLIDQHALRKALEDNICEDCDKDPNWLRCGSCLMDVAIEYIIAAPTIDAVEVVRKPVCGYDGYYEVDNLGRVFGCDRVIDVDDNGRQYAKPVVGKEMAQTLHSKGYKTVSLTKDGKTKTAFVHRIVAEAFIPNPNGYPMINHKDEDKTNNFVGNLEWCTNRYNTMYGNGRAKRVEKIKGIPHTEEHKRKISESVKRYHQSHKGERKGEE